MKITALETIRCAIQPNLLFVCLHTDSGLVGLGEAFFGARAVEAYLHETAAPDLFSLTDPSPEAAAKALASYVGFQGGGVETRGNGAIDLALWDLLGQASGLPVVELLGGPCRATLRTYNTCAGPGYVRTLPRQSSTNWGLPPPGDRADLEDLQAFLTRPGELADQLRSEGISGMKVWPFDLAAEESGGNEISAAALKAGLGIVEAIRSAVGDAMDVMIELHGLWDRRCAATIIKHLRPYDPYWVEDPVRADAVDALIRLSDTTDVSLAVGETVTGRRGFAHLLAKGAIDVATVDVQWTGGLTEARKVASLADTYAVPVAPHDCTGPVTFAAATHLSCSQPNGLIQETVRAFLRTWYAELVDGVPQVVDGLVTPSRAPGLGVSLRPDLRQRPDVQTRTSSRTLV